MGLPAVLEVIIGLVFVYFLTSVLCSGLNEMLAQRIGRRGEFLREGMINLVRDRWIYLRIINHPLVSSLYRDVPGKPRTPSYIPAANFTQALLDIVLLKASQLDPQFKPGAQGRWKVEDLRTAAQMCKAAGDRSAMPCCPSSTPRRMTWGWWARTSKRGSKAACSG